MTAPNTETQSVPSVLAGGEFGAVIQSTNTAGVPAAQIDGDLNVEGALTVNGSPVGGNPAGADTQVQYNNAGAFGASPHLTFDGNTLSINDDSANTLAISVNGLDAGGNELTLHTTSNLNLNGFYVNAFVSGALDFEVAGDVTINSATSGGFITGDELIFRGGNAQMKLINSLINVLVNADNGMVWKDTSESNTFGTINSTGFNAANNVVLGTSGANTLGFFGSSGAAQQTVTAASASPTLTGTYATDVTALQATLDNLVTVINGLLTKLEAYNLVTD